jgi:biopolymer transport protein ExbD
MVLDSNLLASPLRRRGTSDDNMIPLINIVFLLLIFFMVASQIDAFRPADVALPEMDEREKATVTDLTIVVAASGDIFIDEQGVSLQQLGQWIEAQHDALAETKMTLQADKQVTSAALSPVLAILREQGISDVTLHVQRKVTEG